MIAQAWGWRSAFYLAALPGFACAAAVLLVAEPRRSGTDASRRRHRRRKAASPYGVVLSIPTLWWLIVSGAIHNFTLYAISSFLSPYLMRYHGTTLRDAGLVSMMVYGVGGGLGLLLGGIAADAAVRRRADGRMLVAAGAILGSVPLLFLALGRSRGDTLGFALLAGVSIVLMYVYYPAVYAGIQDVVGPRLRGTAMALYFLAMYVLGASLGPLATGLLSDRFTVRPRAPPASSRRPGPSPSGRPAFTRRWRSPSWPSSVPPRGPRTTSSMDAAGAAKRAASIAGRVSGFNAHDRIVWAGLSPRARQRSARRELLGSTDCAWIRRARWPSPDGHAWSTTDAGFGRFGSRPARSCSVAALRPGPAPGRRRRGARRRAGSARRASARPA